MKLNLTTITDTNDLYWTPRLPLLQSKIMISQNMLSQVLLYFPSHLFSKYLLFNCFLTINTVSRLSQLKHEAVACKDCCAYVVTTVGACYSNCLFLVLMTVIKVCCSPPAHDYSHISVNCSQKTVHINHVCAFSPSAGTRALPVNMTTSCNNHH